MEIIAHRGLWAHPGEKNTLCAIRRAAAHGFGVETDVRDHNGLLVVSHEIPDENAFPFEDVLRVLQGTDLPLAINIKADGLAARLRALLERYGIRRYFVFDMSSPELLSYVREGLRIHARLSDWENPPVHLPVSGLWVDSLERPAGRPLLERADGYALPMCIVSEELHGRDHDAQWAALRAMRTGEMMLCTDEPLRAREVFSC